MNRRKRIPAWKLSRDGLSFRASFLQALLESPIGNATADEAVTDAERSGRRLGTGKHIGPVVSDLHRCEVIEPVVTPDGYRAAIRSIRRARRLGLSGVWKVADRKTAEAELSHTLQLLKSFPKDYLTKSSPSLFDCD